MKNRHRLLIAGVLIVLAGCASSPPQKSAEQGSKAAPDNAAAPAAEEDLPEVELSANLLYKILIAEFAAQEGQLQLSAEAYFKSAEESQDPRLARRATQTAVYARNIDTALQSASLWVKLAPNDIDARQSLAALLVREGAIEQALPHMEKLLELHPEEERSHGYLIVAGLLARIGNTQQALQHMADLMGPYADDPEALYAEAKLAHELGENAIAEEKLQRLLSMAPDHTDGLILQARVLHASGKEEEAIASLKLALDQNPDNDQMRLTYARMLVDVRQLKEARKQFRILHKRLPENTDVIYALGLLAMEAGDVEEAEPFFLDLVRLGERDEEARFALGQIADSRGRPQEAIEWFQSIAYGERYMEAQLQAAKVIATEQGIDNAIVYLKQVDLHERSDRIERHMAIAELYASQERYQEAMESYNEALELFPDSPELLYARALTAEKMGRIDWLERDLQRIIKQDPENAQALNALGYTLADRTQRYDEALGYIQRAYALHPDDPAILDSLGWVQYRMGNYEKAREFLNRAAEKMRDGEIAAHLGEVLWMSGDKQKARKVWNEALEYDPDNAVLQETLERLKP